MDVKKDMEKFRNSLTASSGRCRIKAWGEWAGEERTPVTMDTSQGPPTEAKERFKREYFH